MTEVHLCTTLVCAYDWLTEFQALAGAIAALLAALIVYASASSRAESALRAAEKTLAEPRRAAAAAVWTELAYCLTKLTADGRALRNDAFLSGGTMVLRVFMTPLFDAHPQIVGALPPDDAFAAAHAYQLLRNLNDGYRAALTANALTRQQVAELATRIDEVAAAVKSAVERLRAAAGISKDGADRAVTAYMPFGGASAAGTAGAAGPTVTAPAMTAASGSARAP